MVAIFVSMISVVFYHFEPPCRSDPPLPTDQSVRQMLQVADQLGGEQRSLIALGEKAFPIYRRILSAQDVGPTEVIRIFHIVAAVKATRTQFLEDVLAALTHSNFRVRLAALHLFSQIGSARDVAPVVALLADEKWEVPFAAAKALATVGDGRTLTAFDVWLNSGKNRDDAQLRQYMAKCREELMQRLDKQKSDPKK